MLKRDNAHDNVQKQSAREYLCAISNYYLKGSSNRMLELLGGGTGAEYYSKNIPKLNSIVAIDSDHDKVELFRKANKDNKIITFKSSLENFLEATINDNDYNFDIVNLDFCTYYYEHEMKTQLSAGQNMHALFRNKPFKVGSLIFVTFMVNGFQVAISPYKDEIIKDAYLIADRIKSIARHYNIDIELAAKDVFDGPSIFIYRPGNVGWNQMMHCGFIVNSI